MLSFLGVLLFESSLKNVAKGVKLMDWSFLFEIIPEIVKGFNLEHFFEHFTFFRTIIAFLSNFLG